MSLPGDIDAGSLLEYLKTNSLTGIYYKLDPFKAESSVKETVRNIAAGNLAKIYFRDRLISEADSAGIIIRPVKGAAFLENLYEDISLRPMCDIDFIFPLEKKKELEKLLFSLGHKRNRLTPFEADSYYHLSYSNGFLKSEYHHSLTGFHTRVIHNNFGVFKKTEDVKHFREEDHFIYLLIHFASPHNFQSLISLCDLFLFRKKFRDKIDWASVMEKAYRFNALFELSIFNRFCLFCGLPELMLGNDTGGFFTSAFFSRIEKRGTASRTFLQIMRSGRPVFLIKRLLWPDPAEMEHIFGKKRNIFSGLKHILRLLRKSSGKN
ncbi:MAG: nucleotidyltransferase family protein [Fibrobacterota bacterium]